MSTACATDLRRMSQNTFDDKSTQVHVMVWCRQAQLSSWRFLYHDLEIPWQRICIKLTFTFGAKRVPIYYSDAIMSVSDHRRLHCLLNCCFRRRSKKTSKLRVTYLCEGNSPVTGEFPAQRASNAENVAILMTSSCALGYQQPLYWHS